VGELLEGVALSERGGIAKGGELCKKTRAFRFPAAPGALVLELVRMIGIGVEAETPLDFVDSGEVTLGTGEVVSLSLIGVGEVERGEVERGVSG